jgi:hypothetical protein
MPAIIPDGEAHGLGGEKAVALRIWLFVCAGGQCAMFGWKLLELLLEYHGI